MDWNTFGSVTAGASAAATCVGLVTVTAVKYFVRREAEAIAEAKDERLAGDMRERLEEIMDRKLAEQTRDILKQVNGTYMRGQEQRNINEGFASELREIRERIDKMHGDMAHLTASLGRLHVDSFRSRAAGAGQ